MKLALLLNVVDPLIGGVLIMGHRGTGKSTAVRALADLLPQITVVEGCPYNCDPEDACDQCRQKANTASKETAVPVVELPLGATEDRVCGTIDIERALSAGRKAFDPGLLARANRGFLYIDEVNLLEDHLVDLLLDVAVTGINKVEREGVSVEHPASFVLIGSGNPEEGELRPQLLDRFGLHAEVTTENYLQNRVDIIERRDRYDRDREAFCDSFTKDQEQLRKRITKARAGLNKLTMARPVLEKIAQLCADLKVDGHRGELTIMRAARALAAFEGRKAVTEAHVKRVSAMALRHRLRRDALDETATSEQMQQAVEEVFPSTPPPPKPSSGNGGGDTPQRQEGPGKSDKQAPRQRATASGSTARPNTADVLSPPGVEKNSGEVRLDEHLRTDRKEKSITQSRRISGGKAALAQRRGRYTRAVAFRSAGARIAIDATLRALAGLDASLRVPVSSEALRYKMLKHKQGTLFVFAIDASGSMGADRIARAKSTILKLLRKSY